MNSKIPKLSKKSNIELIKAYVRYFYGEGAKVTAVGASSCFDAPSLILKEDLLKVSGSASKDAKRLPIASIRVEDDLAIATDGRIIQISKLNSFDYGKVTIGSELLNATKNHILYRNIYSDTGISGVELILDSEVKIEFSLKDCPQYPDWRLVLPIGSKFFERVDIKKAIATSLCDDVIVDLGGMKVKIELKYLELAQKLHGDSAMASCMNEQSLSFSSENGITIIMGKQT